MKHANYSIDDGWENRLWVGRFENVRSIIYLAPPMQTLRSFQFLIEHFSYTHLGFFCHVHQL